MNKRNILVVAPHPDDETLGCGGTLLKFREQGANIFWLIMTQMNEKVGFTKQRMEARKKEITAVTKAYGFKDVFQLGFTTTQLDQYPLSQIVDQISNVVLKVEPMSLFIPFYHDIHSDHRVAFAAVQICSKSFRYPSIQHIAMYETLSETNLAPALVESTFIPNSFCDISAYLDKKVEIMKLYKGEIANHPFPRSEESIKALAILRGTQIHAKYAESFMLLKTIF